MLVWSLNIIPRVLFFGSFILSFYYTTFPKNLYFSLGIFRNYTISADKTKGYRIPQ